MLIELTELITIKLLSMFEQEIAYICNSGIESDVWDYLQEWANRGNTTRRKEKIASLKSAFEDYSRQKCKKDDLEVVLAVILEDKPELGQF
jgi:hypothetical protein